MRTTDPGTLVNVVDPIRQRPDPLQEALMSEQVSIAERRPIRVDQVPWYPFEQDGVTVSIDLAPGAEFRPLMEDPSTQALFVHLRFSPNYVAPAHWHPSNTIYIFTKGEFSVEGEPIYRPGDVRWIKGGKPYGAESAGPEGCEFYLASLGPFATYDPVRNPAPAQD
jgi:quercetin dioxygenase-like cupin family protein